MVTYTLIDGSNWLRRKFEEDRNISGLRASVNALRSEIARPGNQVVFFWDGSGGNDYRKAIFPDYKGNRDKTNDGLEEFYIQQRIFREIVRNLPIPYFRTDGYEADDIIAAFASVLPPESKVHIKSTDKDFEQIPGSTHEGKTITEVLQKEIDAAAAKGKPIVGADPVVTSDLVIPFKVMVGDKSDNIPGIPGFGAKRWLLSDKAAIDRWFRSDFDPICVPEMSDKLQLWCAENRDLLRAMRDICRFRTIDKELLNTHMKMGVDNPSAVEQILKENLA